ncbi:hypothetical protein Mag101_16690 [Microbulbifer agarilyticus]|uniref:DUF2939 domain-containing protein n=1 Tax=Microbulbifer agarilyticus TaxID=260552 RepID=A0A1Q2M8U9_9GAMM|nr:DUF2939 domain-containing protein [Microbulbifer agarilyticus]AQQ69079.1 hypothetical protein Mag101_16690 [Microbulbifer agarilyticus]
MGKWLLRSLLLLSVLIMFYVALPWYSAHQLIEAAQNEDVARLERYVDFPQLRGNIRGRLQEEIRESISDDIPPALGDLFKAGADLFVGPLLERLISPEGIVQLVQGQKDWREFERELSGMGGRRAPEPSDNQRPAQSEQAASPVAERGHHWRLHHWYFIGLNAVEVVCGNRDDFDRVLLRLQRNGLRWQLVDIELIDEVPGGE